MATARTRFRNRELRTVDLQAVRRAAMMLRPLPAEQVHRVVAAYVREQRVAALWQNPVLATLANLRVGETAPWPYRVLRVAGRPNVYMQAFDTERAREMLNNSRARWRFEDGPDGRIVRRVA